MPEVMAFIANSVQAERCRLDGNVRCATPVWTALGDAYFPGGFTRYPPSTSTLVYRSDRAFFAPRVKGIIVADFHSMYARAPYASGLGEPASFAPGELLRIFRELDRGFEVIESVARAARDLIALFAKQIVLRKHASVPDVFRAFSLTDYLGRITILNPQLKRWNRFAFADALLHEAMHSFFFALELKEGSFVRSMSTALATKIRSPWTGAELDMYAYVHACLVWFGLFRFWSRATRRRGLPRAQVSAMAAEAGRGFRTQRLTEVPGARDVMRPEIVRAIDAMQRSVTAT
jgi:hypothetical protein